MVVRIFSSLTILLLFALMAKAQIIEGQTPSPCKRLTGNDFVALQTHGRPYIESPEYLSCQDSPITHTENGIQGFGEAQVSYYFPSHTITFKGGKRTSKGYATQDVFGCTQPTFAPTLTIELSQPATEVSFDLQNYAAKTVTFTITDNLGRTETVSRPPQGQVNFPLLSLFMERG